MPGERDWARRTAQGWSLAVHVQPGAKRSGIAGLHGDRLKIRIASPAIEGRANEALIELVADTLGVPKRNVSVTAGEIRAPSWSLWRATAIPPGS